jgi:hypothetical protein
MIVLIISAGNMAAILLADLVNYIVHAVLLDAIVSFRHPRSLLNIYVWRVLASLIEYVALEHSFRIIWD